MLLPPVLKEPLIAPDAEKLARRILEQGAFTISRHAEEELKKDRLTSTDVLNVLRAGPCIGRDYEKQSWRYRFATPKIAVVVAFRSQTELVVVTAWRIK